MITIALAFVLCAQEANPLEKFSAGIDAVPDKGGAKSSADSEVRKIKAAMRECAQKVFKDPAKPNLYCLRENNMEIRELAAAESDSRIEKLLAIWASMVKAGNPLESFRSGFAAVKADTGTAGTDAGVKKVQTHAGELIDALKDPLWPDWNAVKKSGTDGKTALNDDALKSDPRQADLRKAWEEAAAVVNAVYRAELDVYRKSGPGRLARIVRSAQSHAMSYGEERFRRNVAQLDLVVREIQYVATFVPDYRNLVCEKKKGGDVTLGQVEEEAAALLRKCRDRLEQEKGAGLARAKSKVQDLYDGAYQKGLQAAERARAIAGSTDDEVLEKHGAWKGAWNYFRSFVRTLEEQLAAHPTLKEETFGGRKAGDLLETGRKQLDEAEKETKALEPKVDAIYKARREAWVKSLAGDKKRIYDEKGMPSARNKDESRWAYHYSTGGEPWTMMYVFDGDKLRQETEYKGEHRFP